MAYSDPQLEARLKSRIAGTANQQTPIISQPTRYGGFSDPILEARLNNTQRRTLPPLTPIQSVQTQQPKQDFSFSESAKSLGSGIAKFVARTGVTAIDQIAKGLDFTVDMLITQKDPIYDSDLIDRQKEKNPELAKSLLEQKQKRDDWLNWYQSKRDKDEIITQKFKKYTEKLQNLDYIKPSQEWTDAPIEEKLTSRVGETIINIGPSILGSLIPYAVNPYAGFAVTASSTADDVKTEAMSYGVESDKAQSLGAATGLIVGALDKIVPDEILSPKVKQTFIQSLAKRLFRVSITASKEVGTEMAQENVQLIAESTFRDDLGFDEVKTRNAMSAFGGLLGGGVMGSLADFTNNVLRKDILKDPNVKETSEYADQVRKSTEDPDLGYGYVAKSKEDELAKKVSSLAKNSLENKNVGVKEKSLEQLRIAADEGKTFDPVKIRKIDEGDIVIEDGRHRLKVALEKNVPITFEDITAQYNKDYSGDLVKELQEQKFDYGSTQLDLTGQVAEDVTEFAKSLPENILVKEEADGGRETEPHITVLYGLDTTNEAQVRGLVQEAKPIEVELGEVSQFDTNEDYDVLKVDVVSDQLSELNAKLDKVLATPGKTFDEYQPHVTIAYVKKGEGQKYVGDTRFKGQKITLDNLTFSTKDGKRINIPLAGKQAENGASGKVVQSKESKKEARKYDTAEEYIDAVKPDGVKILERSKFVDFWQKENGKINTNDITKLEDNLEYLRNQYADLKESGELDNNLLRKITALRSKIEELQNKKANSEKAKKQVIPIEEKVSEEIKDILSKSKPVTLKREVKVYHGGTANFVNRLENGRGFLPIAKRDAGTGGNFYGLSTTTDLDMARDFSTSSSGSPAVAYLTIKKGTKALELSADEFVDNYEEATLAELSKDYDVIIDKNNVGGESEIRVLNQEALKETTKPILTKEEVRAAVDKKFNLTNPIKNVDNKVVTLYRGFRKSDLKEGNYFSTDKEFAREFTNLNEDSEIKELRIPADQIYRMKELPMASSVQEIDAAIQEANSKGYKAFYVNEGVNQPDSVFFIDKVPAEVNEITNTKKKTPKAKSRLKQFPSVYAGLSSKTGEKIHNFELRKPPKPGTEEFKLHKKVTELIRKYAQTIGEGYTPRNALGVYFPKTKNIRTNAINNVTVAAHEIAHFLDYANGITDKLMSAKDKKIQEQIQKIYLQYYPNARESHQKKLQTLEGFATLLQKYTEQPTTITNEYPDLVKEFLQKDGKYYTPVIGEILTDLNQMIGEYQGLEALDKIGARVTSEGTGINKPSFLNFWQKLRTQVADEVYPVEVLAKKGKVSFTKEDPSLWVRAYNSVSGIINNNISTDRGYWSFTDLQNGWQKKYDYNWKSLIESTQRRGVLDSFSHFLVARREWYMYQELDQIKATRDQVELIAKAFQAVEPGKEAEFDRDLRATLSEDFGIDITEMELDKAKKAIQKLFEQTDKAYQEQKEILENDAFSREEAEAAYNENKDRFKDEETMFDALTREDLELMHNQEVQLINDKTYNQLKSKEGYASFKRQFYDEIVGDLDAPGVIRVSKTKISSLIGRKGSERTIINPLFSAVANHSEIVRKSMKQVVYNQVGKLGTSALMPNLMQVVPLKTTVDKNTGAISYPQEKDNNIIMARQGYKRVPVLMDGEIKTIIDMVLTHKNIDTFTQLYTGLSRMFTAGTTGLYPQFALTNFVVDQITATANSYNKFKGMYSPMKEMLTVLRKKNSVEAKYYEEYLVMGGERQTFTGWQRLEPKDLFKRISDEKTRMQKALDGMQKGIDILSIPSAKSEIFSRATEYINARKAGKSQIVALEEAGRVTAPFHHVGAWGAKEGQRSFGQTFIRGLPFFNASIQVLDQTARVANTKEGRKRMTFVTIAITAAYLSAIMAMMDASDDQKEQYKDLEAEDLANFIYFPNPSGKGLLRVKMANTFSIPGTLMNMAIANKMFSANYGARDAMEAATAFLPDQFNVTDPTKAVLGWIPQVFKPTAHIIFNVKEYPSVRPLVSQGLLRKPPELQYHEGTSIFAKKIGEIFKLSPIKVDYFINGHLGRVSEFLTGKPGVYNPARSIMRDYYFTQGRRLVEFDKVKNKNDAEYTAYQNLEKKYEDLPKDRVDEIYRVKLISDQIDKLVGEYYDVDPKVEQEKAAELRAKILLHIENLENGTKPKNFGKWSMEARKRRNKNKLDKK